jgi:hypothetical protein
MEALVAKRISAKVVMPAIPGTPAATAGTQRRPKAAVISSTADLTATSEIIRNIRDVGSSRDTSSSSAASNFFNQ